MNLSLLQVDTPIGSKLEQLAKCTKSTNLRCLTAEGLKEDFFSIIPSHWMDRDEVRLSSGSGEDPN